MFDRDTVMHEAYMEARSNLAGTVHTNEEFKDEMKKVLKDNGFERFARYV